MSGGASQDTASPAGPTPALPGRRRLEDLDCGLRKNILILAPHPDDFDAVAVTLRFFQERGDNLRVAVLTGGASGVEDEFAGTADPALKAAIREAEQRASAAAFGLAPAALEFLRLEETPAGRLADTADNREKMRRLLQTAQPDFVFLPHGNDTHPDHRLVWAIFSELATGLSKPVTAWLNEDPKTLAMRHDLFTFFAADAAAWKGHLLRLHRSQHERNLRTRGHGFDERILAGNRAAAARWPGNAEFAEVFELRGACQFRLPEQDAQAWPARLAISDLKLQISEDARATPEAGNQKDHMCPSC